jgi:hypothetical protein
VYEVAEPVLRWRSEGRSVVLLRAATMWGASTKWPAQGADVHPRESPVGSFLAGVLNDHLTALALDLLEFGGSGQVADVPVDGGQARFRR